MEPLNVTIAYDGTAAEMWSGHQMPGIDRDVAAKVLGLEPAAVKVNTTYAGGSFGRRGSKTSDYVTIAAQLAKVVKKPIKVVWSREDDMRAGYYRPMAFHRVTLGMDGKKLVAWDHHVVAQSIMRGSPFEPMMIKDGVESAAVEGVTESPYDLPVFRCLQTLQDTPMTTLWWRSVGHTHTAFVMETMIDELAVASGEDPLKLRRSLLKGKTRQLAVLDLLAKRSGWGHKKAPKGRAWGLALHQSFGSVVGQVAEVSLENGKTPRVHKVWAAVHCGQVVNPEVAKSQVESAIVYGLSAAFYQEVKIEKGQVVTSNFDDYPVLRINEMPEIDVAFVETHEPPTGLGEPGLPPIAPAVANALFALTQKRVRALPLSKTFSV
jgi:isoquinoline 1-oxidoreductase beta subunit